MEYKKQTKKAFTLVELIVVIVILAILATIAFLSFSSQTSSARDSTRLSDLSNITKGISVFQASAGTLPKPDQPVNITASGTTIGYQGYAGTNLLQMIKISANGGKDPLDQTNYTYSTNSNLTKFELLGFLEDGSNSALSYLPQFSPSVAGLNPQPSANADPASYSGRSAMTKGDTLGILLNIGTMLPIQANGGTGVDISSTSGSYIVQFTKNDSISGTGGSLLSNVINRNVDLQQNKSVNTADTTLVGFWDMESMTQSGSNMLMTDFSNNHLNGTCYFSGAITSCLNGTGPQKNGRGLTFNGDKSILMIPATFTNLNLNNKDFTIALNALPYSTGGDTTEQLVFGTDGNWHGIYYNQTNKRFYFELWNTTPTRFTTFGNANVGNWNNVIGRFNSATGLMEIFINGAKTGQVNFSGTAFYRSGYNFHTGPLTSYAYGFFSGKIGDVRFYNRTLSDTEIKYLSDISSKINSN